MIGLIQAPHGICTQHHKESIMASRRQRRAQRKAAATRRFLARKHAPYLLPTQPLPQEISMLPVENPLLTEGVMRLAEFGLSSSLAESLFNKGIPTIGDLTRKSEDELLDLPGIGVAKFSRIKRVLESRGLSFR